MSAQAPDESTLQVELFVNDLATSIDFYQRVLGFQPGAQKADAYTPMRKGSVQLALNRLDILPPDHPVQVAGQERVGRGVELVLEVAELQAMYDHVVLQQWPLSGTLQRQPWGLHDFRVVDPDGYYWRVTERRA
jgi:lactoylglutathione lyase